MPFGKIKGQAERELLELSKSIPSLDVINVRPGGVDWTGHTEVIEAYPTNLSSKGKEAIFGLLRTFSPSMVTPTKVLGKYLTDLALEKGKCPTGNGVLEDGGVVTNVGILRAAKEEETKS
jgi:hypothetical protein